MSPQEAVPIYLNWTFWSFLIASIALLASQESRLKSLFKKPRLDFEIFSKIALNHNMGNCGVNVHLHLHNIGGAKLTIRGIEVSLSRDGEEVIKLPSQNYFKEPTDINGVIFTRLSLSPDEEWSHIVTTYQDWSRQEEKTLNDAISNMQSAIKIEKEKLGEHHNNLIAAPNEFVQPFISIFEDKFIWLHGEYKVKIKVLTGNPGVDIEKTFKFTLFEYYEERLRESLEDYKYGSGIYWTKNNPNPSFVGVKVKENS